MRLKLTKVFIVCASVTAIVVLSTCSQSSDKLVTVSYGKPPPPFKSEFKLSKATWQPIGAVHDSTNYLTHLHCLTGSSEPEDAIPRYSLKVCYEINNRAGSGMKADPLKPGIYPIGQLVPGTMYSLDYDKLTKLSFKVTQLPARDGDGLSVVLVLSDAKGSLWIKSSDANHIAGKLDISDKNLSIVGEFDCPYK